MKDNNKDISIALLVVIIILLFLISSFVGDIRRLHKNGVLIYRRHVTSTQISK